MHEILKDTCANGKFRFVVGETSFWTVLVPIYSKGKL